MSNNSTANTSPTASELTARYGSLQVRTENLGQALQALTDLKEKPQSAQESFVLASSDFQLVQMLLKSSRDALKGINIVHSSKEEGAASGGPDEELSAQAAAMVEAMSEHFGISEEALKASMIRSFCRVLDLIDVTVNRAEADLAVINQ